MGSRFVKLGQISIDLLDLLTNGTSLQKQKIKDLLKRTSNCDYKTQILGGLTPVNPTANPDTLYSVIWNSVRRTGGQAVQLQPCFRYYFNAQSLAYDGQGQSFPANMAANVLEFHGPAVKDPSWYEQVANTMGYVPAVGNLPITKASFPDTNATSDHIVNVHLTFVFDYQAAQPSESYGFTIRAALSHSNTSFSSPYEADIGYFMVSGIDALARNKVSVHAHMRMASIVSQARPKANDGRDLEDIFNRVEISIVPDGGFGQFTLVKTGPTTSDLVDGSNYVEILKLLT